MSKQNVRFFSNFSGFLRISEVIVLKPLLIRISEKIPFRLKMTLKIVILHSANLPVLVKLTNVQTSELEVTSSLFWWMPMVLTQMAFYLSQDLTYWMSSHIKCHELQNKYVLLVSFFGPRSSWLGWKKTWVFFGISLQIVGGIISRHGRPSWVENC